MENYITIIKDRLRWIKHYRLNNDDVWNVHITGRKFITDTGKRTQERDSVFTSNNLLDSLKQASDFIQGQNNK